MQGRLRLLLFLRLFMRSFAFAYSLSLTVMYNFWIFGKLPGFAWVSYVVVMAAWELLMGVAGDRLPLGPLLTAYLALAIPLEFPSVFLGGIYLQTALLFLPWALLWYGSLLLLAVIREND
ncbi:hypothetical protein [Thermococcus nautili]|uniref:Uncharacterized protein n=1 Tax=Thermococcus nautili TaxID=195522 RepID=W8PMZ4_9EURY|nr:hypothetical protein [Thermococcus nautili]AHL23409.1 hypothetical protein BD01_1806 [Thermococcus nautili]